MIKEKLYISESVSMSEVKARPFLKWAGGKTQLLSTINDYLPASFSKQSSITYIEPFVGGGAMLFYMMQAYPNIKNAIINDINHRLIQTYIVVRDAPYELIKSLSAIQEKYRRLSEDEAKRELYLEIRENFNSGRYSGIGAAAYMIFLNRTCFNGLYRENSKGEFNVPFGKYTNPTICDAATILADSELLKKVTILQGDFSQVESYVGDHTFVYLDPPYRPLDSTSNFNSYVKENFNDAEQIRLKYFIERMTLNGCDILLSNSDVRSRNEKDFFFDTLYNNFIIERVAAKRSINSNPEKRGLLTELLIRNYENTQKNNCMQSEKTNDINMLDKFSCFLAPLKETHCSLGDYVDFKKVEANVETISIKLNQLNYLLGKENMAEAVYRLWNENPNAFSVLEILIAVRTKDRKKVLDDNGNICLLSDYIQSPQLIVKFLDQTGLTDVFKSGQIKNLVDYVFGVEVGLDSNARKNRGGHIMESIVANIFNSNGIPFRQEVYSGEFPDIEKALGADKKRFDFVVKGRDKTYLIEANFYSGGGSKLNEVARAYSELAPKINAVKGFEFVWITDGVGWQSAKSKLQEAFAYIPKIYNLSTISEFIALLKG